MAEFRLLGVLKVPMQDGYTFEIVNPNELQSTDGGYSKNIAKTRKQQFKVDASYYLGSAAEIAAFRDWYENTIGRGVGGFWCLLDLTGSLKGYECQLAAVPKYGNFTGEFATVTLPLLTVPTFDINSLNTQYGYNSLFASDEDLTGFMSLLPWALDPMGYEPYVP